MAQALIARPGTMSDGDYAQDPATPEHDAPSNGELAAAQLAAVIDAITDYTQHVAEHGDYAVASIYRWQDFMTTIEQITGEDVAA